jgi:hypothetical protein
VSVTGDIGALRRMRDEIATVARDASAATAVAVAAALGGEIHKASVRASGATVEIHREPPGRAYLAPRLERMTGDVIEATLAKATPR